MVSFPRMFTKDSRLLTETQQLLFLKRLERLLHNGYSMINALDVIKWDKQLVDTSDIIIHTITEGKYIDEAFKIAGFHETIVSYLYFVRINGDVMTSIEKCILMFEHRINSIGKFKRVIRYPAVLLVFFLVLLFFLKFSVLPAFANMFQTSDESTKSVMISIQIINLLGTVCILAFIFLVIAGIIWKFVRPHMDVEQKIRLYNKVPIYRRVLCLQTSYYFATHMSMFLKTGMSMKNVILHMVEQKELPLLAYYAEMMQLQLQNGFYIDQLLTAFDFMENQMTTIFENNNNITDLQQDLTAYSEYVAETMEQKVMKLITLIQPIFFSVLAGLIIFVYLTLMWPMFQLIQTV